MFSVGELSEIVFERGSCWLYAEVEECFECEKSCDESRERGCCYFYSCGYDDFVRVSLSEVFYSFHESIRGECCCDCGSYNEVGQVSGS